MGRLLRTDALKATLTAFEGDPVIVALGTTSREVMAISQSDLHLHVLDSMGLNAAIGLGVALGLADRHAGKVLVLEGDGGLLMGASTLATVGLLRPANLVIAVFDDGAFTATGGQRTASPALDLPAVARGFGLEAYDANTVTEVEAALASARGARAPVLVRVAIAGGKRDLPFFLPDPPVLTDRFTRSLRTLR